MMERIHRVGSKIECAHGISLLHQWSGVGPYVLISCSGDMATRGSIMEKAESRAVFLAHI